MGMKIKQLFTIASFKEKIGILLRVMQYIDIKTYTTLLRGI